MRRSAPALGLRVSRHYAGYATAPVALSIPFTVVRAYWKFPPDEAFLGRRTSPPDPRDRLNLEEKQALVAFLRSLTGDIHEGVETMVVEVR